MQDDERHPDFIPGYDASPFGVTPAEIVAWLRDGKKDVRSLAATLIETLLAEIEVLEQKLHWKDDLT